MCSITAVVAPNGVVSSRPTDYSLSLLHGVRHRGKASTGIGYRNNGHFERYIGTGSPQDVFNSVLLEEKDGFPTDVTIGHGRYPTQGKSDESTHQNAHPIVATYGNITVHVVANGEISPSEETMRELRPEIEVSATEESDSGKLAKILLNAYLDAKDPDVAAKQTYETIFRKGMTSAAAFIYDKEAGEKYLVVLRDGGRPLSRATVETPEGIYHLYASETVAFNNVGGVDNIEEVEPGTIVVHNIVTGDIHSWRMPAMAACSFEALYKGHQDSDFVQGVRIGDIRKQLGMKLAERDVDLFGDDVLVSAVPNSGIEYARGYVEKLGLELTDVIVKNKRSKEERSFQQPTQEKREEAAWRKFDVNENVDVAGKTVVLIDDSIVRGTVLKVLVEKLQARGAKEVHIRSGSAPIIGGCRSGVDMYNHDLMTHRVADRQSVHALAYVSNVEQLEAGIVDLPEFENLLGDDGERLLQTVKYVPFADEQAVFEEMGILPQNVCTGCRNGEYPYESDVTNASESPFKFLPQQVARRSLLTKAPEPVPKPVKG